MNVENKVGKWRARLEGRGQGLKVASKVGRWRARL